MTEWRNQSIIARSRVKRLSFICVSWLWVAQSSASFRRWSANGTWCWGRCCPPTPRQTASCLGLRGGCTWSDRIDQSSSPASRGQTHTHDHISSWKDLSRICDNFRTEASCLSFKENVFTAQNKQEYTQPFYSHLIHQPVLTGIPVKNCRIFLEQRRISQMPLLTLTPNSAIGLRRRR